MKRPIDPLLIVTIMVGLALLALVGRYAVTGQPLDKDILTTLGTIFGGLLAALANKRKDGDDDDDPKST